MEEEGRSGSSASASWGDGGEEAAGDVEEGEAGSGDSLAEDAALLGAGSSHAPRVTRTHRRDRDVAVDLHLLRPDL